MFSSQPSHLETGFSMYQSRELIASVSAQSRDCIISVSKRSLNSMSSRQQSQLETVWRQVFNCLSVKTLLYRCQLSFETPLSRSQKRFELCFLETDVWAQDILKTSCSVSLFRDLNVLVSAQSQDPTVSISESLNSISSMLQSWLETGSRQIVHCLSLGTLLYRSLLSLEYQRKVSPPFRLGFRHSQYRFFNVSVSGP
jgi:hypothetical protein